MILVPFRSCKNELPHSFILQLVRFKNVCSGLDLALCTLFRQPAFQALLKHLARKCLGTNMSVEGLLAQLRAAVPVQKVRAGGGGPNAERFAYTGVLSQLMHRHIQSGGEDSRRVTFQQMLRAGVPLDIPRSEPWRARKSRRDSQYVMLNLHKFLRERPRGADEIEVERLRLYSEWRLATDAERDLAIPPEPPLPDVGDGTEILPDPLRDHFIAPSWSTGDEAWPVSENVLRSLQADTVTGNCDGIASKMQSLRWQYRHDLLAQDLCAIPEHVVSMANSFLKLCSPSVPKSSIGSRRVGVRHRGA